MKSYFDNSERISRLSEVARSWLGTPFAANAAVKGAGVSCHMLVGRIYIECGFLPETFAFPTGRADWGHAHRESIMSPFMDALPNFEAGTGWVISTGDTLGIKIGGCVHHLGVALPDDRFIHCLSGDGVQISNVHDATWMTRIARIWRPVE